MRYIIERLPSGEYVVYDETGAEVGRFDSKEAADAEFADAAPRGTYPEWQPGQPIPELAETGTVTQAPQVNVFWDQHPDEYNQWQRWNAQQKLVDGPTLGSAQAEAAFGYMEPFGLEEFGQALTLYSGYLYEPALGIPPPSQAVEYAEGRAEEAAQQAQAWAATTAVPAPPPGTQRPSTAPSEMPTVTPEQAQSAVVQAVDAVTSNYRVRAAMLMAAGLEGGGLTGPWAVGGDGEVGPWQIHPVHFGDISAEDAADPLKAAKYMVTRFEDAILQGPEGQGPIVPDALWESDPALAAVYATFLAERPGGFPKESEGGWRAATPQMALEVYTPTRVEAAWQGAGGTGTAVGGATVVGPGGWPTGPYVPPGAAGAEGVPSLTPDQHVQWTEYDIAFDMPQNVFKAALAQGIDPLAYWFDLQERALDVALEADQITREEYDQAKELRLSTDQILVARDLDLDLQSYRDLAIIGVSDAAIAQFQSWGVEPEMYLWARTEGALSHAQIQQTVQAGGDLVETVAENRMPEEDERRFAEFNRAWNAEERKFPFELATDPNFALWRAQQREAAWEAEQTALDARRERTEARLRSEIGGTVPGAPTAVAPAPPGTTPIIGATPERAAFDGRTGTFVPAELPEEEKVEPYKAPDADLLMLQAAREVPMMRDATPQEMREGVFRGATRQVLGGPLAGPKVMPARHRLTTFGSFAMGPRMAQSFLRGPVSTRNPAQARRAEETRRRIVEARPEIADMEEEERRRYNLPRTRATPIPQP